MKLIVYHQIKVKINNRTNFGHQNIAHKECIKPLPSTSPSPSLPEPRAQMPDLVAYISSPSPLLPPPFLPLPVLQKPSSVL